MIISISAIALWKQLFVNEILGRDIHEEQKRRMEKYLDRGDDQKDTKTPCTQIKSTVFAST